jgi:hypothetical protein
VAAVQRRDHRVQAAVPTGHHHPPAAAAMQHAVQLALVPGVADLHVTALAEHRERPLEVGVAVAAGLGVGDQQQWFHGSDPTSGR